MDMVQQEKLDMAIVDTTSRDRSLHFRKLGQRDLCVALPHKHPLAQETILLPQQIAAEPQIVFNSNLENSFEQWASGNVSEEHIVCTVNTASAALDLVAAQVGLCVMPRDAMQDRDGVRYVPVQNWHQAMYMCILYDKWLEPPVWNFVEGIVSVIRRQQSV